MARLQHWGLAQSLADRAEAQLLRSLRTLESAQGPRVTIDGRNYLAFCSNDYLGLAAHPDLRNALKNAADRHGVGSGASALVCGRHRLHVELEEALSAYLGSERCLLFSTGYMANLGVATALLGKEDVIFSDALNHASLIDAARVCGAQKVRYAHAQVDELRDRLARHSGRRSMVMSDGLFSMDGDIAPVAQLRIVADQAGAGLWIDDAHGIGVLGEQGRGVLEHLGLDMRTADILVGTLGKAFGAAGAFVCASNELIETLVQHARNYIYTTAPPPAVAAAALAGLQVSQREAGRRVHLREMIGRFRAGAAQLGLPLAPVESPIQPVQIGSAEDAVRVASSLQEQGLLVLPMRPPTVPEGTSRLRITFSAAHQAADIDRLLEALDVALRPVGSPVARAS